MLNISSSGVNPQFISRENQTLSEHLTNVTNNILQDAGLDGLQLKLDKVNTKLNNQINADLTAFKNELNTDAKIPANLNNNFSSSFASEFMNSSSKISVVL